MINGQKITLGPLMPTDFGAMFRWINDADAARLDLAYRPTDWSTFYSWTESLSKDQTRIVFSIRKLNEPPSIGFVGFSCINAVHRSADLSIRIGEEADRHRGYGTEAIRLALDFAWRHMNLHRIALTALAHNERAIRTFEAAGFEREGLSRSACFIAGRWCDVVTMGALSPASSQGAGPIPLSEMAGSARSSRGGAA